MAARRSLWPREHGAYAQLAAPLVAALLIRGPSLAAVALTLAACAAFLANEPLLVVLGHRGPRMKAVDGARARRRVITLGGIALIAGGLGLASADAATVCAAAGAAVPAAGLIGLAWKRAQHSLLGELLAAVALPAASLPVAVAAGVATSVAVAHWVAWSLGYAATVLAVHRVIARHRAPHSTLDTLTATGLAATAVLLALGAATYAIALPLLVVSIALVIHPPRPRHLRAIGVGLVVASTVSIGLAATLV